MRTTVPTVSFLLSAAALALAPLAAQAAMYQATCQGQTVSASSTAAFGPKCTNRQRLPEGPVVQQHRRPPVQQPAGIGPGAAERDAQPQPGTGDRTDVSSTMERLK